MIDMMIVATRMTTTATTATQGAISTTTT
jgi:hypothetical protein